MKLNKILKIILVAVIVFLGNFKVNAATTGSITIDNAANGKTYEIYKLFDATVSVDGTGISYKVPAGKTLTDNPYFKLDDGGNVVKKSDTVNVDSEEFQTWAKQFIANDQPVATQVATSAVVTFNPVPFGFYLVKRNTSDSAVSVDSTMPNVTIKDKNATGPVIPNDPSYGKIIKEGATPSISSTYAIGDQVPFQIKFYATNFVTGNDRVTKTITDYIVTDTPTNLEIINDSIEVTVGTVKLDADKYTVTFDNSKAMKIVIPWINKVDGSFLYGANDQDVIVSYKSLVKAGAANGEAKNEYSVSYLAQKDPTDPNDPTKPDPNNPTPLDPKPTDPGKPDPNKPIIKTYQIKLSKTDANGGAPLTGAKFRLYDAATQGNEINVVKDGNFYRLAEKDKDGRYTEDGVEIEAGTDILIKGLKGSTTYYLEETLAPAGYNKLATRTAVTTSQEVDGKVVDHNADADVQNNKGIELPSTGGIGRTIFYVVGSVLVIGVVITMISRIKMKSVK